MSLLEPILWKQKFSVYVLLYKLSYFFQKYIEMYCDMFGYCWKAAALSGCDGKNEKI